MLYIGINVLPTFLQARFSEKMPVLHLFKPANPYAYNNDHDYGMSMEETFLTSAKVSYYSIHEKYIHTSL